MGKKKKSGKKLSNKRHKNSLQQQERPEQQPEQAHDQAEGQRDDHTEERGQEQQRSCKKYFRLVEVVQERRRLEQQSTEDDGSLDDGQRPQAAPHEPAPEAAPAAAIVPGAIVGAAGGKRQRRKKIKNNLFSHQGEQGPEATLGAAGNSADAGEAHVEESATASGSAHHHFPNGQDDETRMWKPDRKLLEALQSAQGHGRGASYLLNDFLKKTGRFAPIIQCRSLDSKQTPSSFYELLLPLVDRILMKCFLERPAECFQFLKRFIGSALFSDGLCRPAILRTLSAAALRHLVSILLLAVQELPGETLAHEAGYFEFPEDILDGLVRGNHASDMQLCSETERLVTQLRFEREFESERLETLRNLHTSTSRNYDEAGQPCDYRHVSLLPTDKELKVGRQPDLPANRLDGLYEDEEEYIETHFRLLREDFVGPLRSAIQEYVSRSATGIEFRRLDAGSRLFRDVTLLPEFELNTFRFKMNIYGRALDNWESGKALVNGSLLVISRDDFWTMTYATVEEKRTRDGSALLAARVLSGHDHLLQALTISAADNVRFTIIESESYYEAYRHNAAILQRMSPNKMPFKKYLIEQPATIDAPVYLRSKCKASSPTTYAGQGHRYDLSAVVGSVERGAATVDVLDSAQWPKAAAMKLDESQAEALRFALTKEFAIIQGPPGTGKTYIGTKIVDILLTNEKAWTDSRAKTTSSILTARRQHTDTSTTMFEGQSIAIICYTNHALDQFLEHIMKRYPNKVVRVGGNSGNAVLDQFNIKELMKNQKLVRSQEYYRVRDKIQKQEKEIEIASKTIADNLSWNEAAGLLKSSLAKQIGNVERWKRWAECRDLADAAAKKHLAERVTRSSNSGAANGATYLSDCTEMHDLSTQEMSYDLSARNTELRTLEVPPINDNTHVNGSAQYSSDVKRMPNDSKLNDDYTNAKSSPLRMTYDELEAVSDMWQLGIVERRRMLNCLTYTNRLDKESKISELIRKVATLKDTLHELRMVEMLPVFKDRPIVGMTVTGAAKYSALMRLLKPRIVIIEEAAEVLEAHILTSLTESCQHLILIGDHQQLRPNPCMYELVQKYNMDVSLFERMVKHNGLPFMCLKVQHRMRPEISKVMSLIFYDDLRNHRSVEGRPNVKGILKNIFFVNHQQLEGGDDMDMRSHVNFHEARMVVGLCGHLLKQAYEPAQITVLVAYLGQLFECKRMLQQYQQNQLECGRIRVTTVDNYQGEENDIIILSLVRSNDRGSVGFLSTDNRICVALSRARLGFYCFGNFELLSRRSETWRSIAKLLSLTEEIGDELPLACHRHPEKRFCVSKPDDFSNYTEGHGCTSTCDERLLCGHSCSDLCHSDDLSHTNQHRCKKPCMRLCAAGRHRGSCKMLCCQPCAPCREDVPRTFEDCGHTCNVECSLTENDVCCMQPVQASLICKHEAQTSCHQNKCTVIDCQRQSWIVSNRKKSLGRCGQLRAANYCFALGTKTYQPCGHQVQVSCHALRCSRTAWEPCTALVTAVEKEEVTMPCKEFAKRQCQARVQKTLSCGHNLTRICSDSTEPLCVALVDVSLPRCGHQVMVRCCDDLQTVIHSEVVPKLLPCGHWVNDNCCNDVQNVSCSIMVQKSLSCGHKALAPCSADPGSLSCSAVTSELLPCGHELTYSCYLRSQQVRTCREMVTKELPCGHQQIMPCFQDVRHQRCSSIIMKELLCGHKVSAQCDQDISERQCSEQTTKQLPCGHRISMPCFEDVNNVICNEVVMKELPCKHRAQMLCSREIGEHLCEEQVQMTLPCSHVVNVSCSSLSASHPPCSQVVSKKLPCGHEKMMPCGDDICKYRCEQTMTIQLICGHSLSVLCYKSDDNKRCIEKVTKVLPCGHKTSLLCFEDPAKHACQEMVEIKLPCNHVLQTACSSKSADDKACVRPVTRQLPCGHDVEMPCFADASVHRCEKTIEKHLPCGHQVTTKCYEALELHQCQKTVTKQLPCGHQASMLCFEDVHTHQCQEKVTKMLPCDHEAPMQLCFEDARYMQCEKLITKKLSCGHDAPMRCFEDPGEHMCHEEIECTLHCGHVEHVECSSNWAEEKPCERPVSRQLPCGHYTVLACHTDVNTYMCDQRIKKPLACGHKKKLKCHVAVDQYQCQKEVTKQLPCGHDAEMLCFEDARYRKCQKKVITILPCAHVALLLCGVDALHVECKQVVKKKLSCGHLTSMPCHQDANAQPCEQLVDKQLPCRHIVSLPCRSAAAGDVHCQEKIKKRLPCDHVVQVACSKDVIDHQCLELVTRPLGCGHSRTASCHLFRCVADGCQVDVQMQIDGNTRQGNRKAKGTCESLRAVKCGALVSAKLPCGHAGAEHRCGDEANVRQLPCLEVICRKFDCGHEAKVSCHVTTCRNPSCKVLASLNNRSGVQCRQAQKMLVACDQTTSYTLPCGHAAPGDVPCHVTRCKDEACSIQLMCRQKWFECQALRQWLRLTDCQVPTVQLLECGHMRTAPCRRSMLCTCRESATAACDNSQVAGGVRSSQQQQPPLKQQPATSTPQPVPDSSAAVECLLHAPCNEQVDKVFECGHRQTVACRDRAKRVACTEQASVVVPTCGHRVQMTCAARRNIEMAKIHEKSSALRCSEEHCALTCSHGGCAGRCSEPCRPCTRPCSTGCPHSQPCTRPCFRPCSAAPCGRPCGRVLSCGHPCLGLCGESCPDVCLSCPKGSRRQELLRRLCAQFGVRPNSKFIHIQPCGHVVPLEKMDEAVRRYDASVVVRSSSSGNLIVSYRVQPLPCPSCHQPVGGCRRYDAILKRYFNMKRKLPADSVGDWLGCRKGHVRPAAEPTCSQCDGSATVPMSLSVGQEVAVIRGKDKGLVGTVTDIEDGEAVVKAGSLMIVIAIECLRATSVAQTSSASAAASGGSSSGWQTVERRHTAAQPDATYGSGLTTMTFSRTASNGRVRKD